MEKLNEEAALAVRCPTCWKPPGEWCVYARRRTLTTARLHFARTHQYWLSTPPRVTARTKHTPLRAALREFDTREEQALRTWLKRNARLFTRL
jgi:hypothetical protein